MVHRKNILLTGSPRCGKSTLIEKLVQRLEGSMTGFFTREIREGGRRVGFSITTLDGKEGELAHTRIPGRIRVGRYGVNLVDIDQIAVPSMIPFTADDWVVIDEIGKMECYSARFRETLIRVLDADNRLIGSIALKGTPFIEDIKRRSDVRLIRVTEQNRDRLVETLLV
jgi:nucleoside-triphosphatase THEP1